MTAGRLAGAAVVAAGATGGALIGWLAERRAAAGVRDGSDPEAVALATPVQGRPQWVTAPDGTRLHVETVGPEAAPTIVLAHGYTMSQAAWHYQRRDLSGEFRVVTYDQRGHGGSEDAAGGDYSMEALAYDLGAVIDRCVPAGEPVIVAGHSMGAMSAISFAQQHPELLGERVPGFVLVSTSGSDIIAGILGASVGALPALTKALLPRVVGLRGRLGALPSDLTFLAIRQISLCPEASPAHVTFTERLALGCSGEVRAALIPAFTSLDLTEAARLVTVPTLVLAGELDRLTPIASARHLVELLPEGQLVELSGVGHMAPLEAHEAVTAHLRAFARRILAKAA